MKRFVCFLLSFLLLLALCACGSEPEESASSRDAAPVPQSAAVEGGATELVLKTEELQPFAPDVTIRDMARIESTILFSLSSGGRHILELAPYTLTEEGMLRLGEGKELPLDEPESPEEDFFYDVTAGGDGCFYLLTGELPEAYLKDGELVTNRYRQNSYRVLRYSSAGELLQVLPLPFFPLEDLRGLAALDENHILLYGDAGLALLDSQGQTLHQEFAEEDTFTLAGQRCGETLYLTRFSAAGCGSYLCCDLKTGETRELQQGNTDTLFGSEAQGLANEYLSETAGMISQIVPETGEKTELMRWNFRNEGCAQVLRLTEQGFLCREDRSGTLTFARMVEQAAREKQTVRVAIYIQDDYMGLVSSAKAALEGFENEDGGYVFAITEYAEDELDKLLTGLVTAEAPDLVIFNGGVNTASPVFLDLYPLLDRDPELGRESFLPNLLETLSVNGELHELWTEVNIATLAARVSDVGDGRGLTTADYDRILAENEQYQAIFQPFMDKVNLLRFVSTVGISRYVNRAEGSCSFDDPGFRELLAWCSQMCDEQPEGNFDGVALYPEDVVLWLEWLQTPQRIGLMRDNVYHEPFVFVGFPTGDDRGSYFTMEGCAMAIPAAAANPEGAWAFLRSRMLPREQDRQYFPVNWQSTKKLLQQSTTAQEDLELLTDLLSRTGFAENIADEALRDIVMDCGLAYLHGEKTLDETIALLQDRASIYMAERYG